MEANLLTSALTPARKASLYLSLLREESDCCRVLIWRPSPNPQERGGFVKRSGARAGRASTFLLALLFLCLLPVSALAGEPDIRVKENGKVRSIPLEKYVLGVVSKEAYADWPIEALKAQAVASRTYAVRRMREARENGQDWDVATDVSHQVYSDVNLPEDSPVRIAVESTTSEGVCYNNDPIDAAFHSTCGGHTEDAEGIWSKPVAYLKSVQCRWCVDAPNYFWTIELSQKEALARLSSAGVSGSRILSIEARGREGSSRVDTLAIETDAGSYEVKGADLRKALGNSELRSLTFQVRLTEDSFKILGSGAGHGVGLCQWGARGQAAEGKTYREILQYYYTGTSPCRLYPK